MNPYDPGNPFVALGVTTRELSYSQVIARRLLTDAHYVAQLSARLSGPPLLTYAPDEVGTEVPLPGAGRLDALARRKGGRAVVVETKVNAPVDLKQQERYVAAGRREYGPDTVFLAYKLGPAVRPGAVPGFTMLTSAELLADLPPGDHLGLRGMLETFVAIERELRADPAAPLRRAWANQGTPLDRFLFTQLRRSFYDYLFDAFRARASFLQGAGVEPIFAIGDRGNALMQFHQPAWYDEARGAQVHFELIANEGSARIALHVETAPYSSSARHHLARKVLVAERLLARLGTVGVPHLTLLKSFRATLAKDRSTTVGTMPVDFGDMEEAAARFEDVHRRCTPYIEQALREP